MKKKFHLPKIFRNFRRKCMPTLETVQKKEKMFRLCQIKLNSNSGSGGGPTRKTEDNSFKVAGVKLIRNAVVTAKPYVYDEHEIGFFFIL